MKSRVKSCFCLLAVALLNHSRAANAADPEAVSAPKRKASQQASIASAKGDPSILRLYASFSQAGAHDPNSWWEDFLERHGGWFISQMETDSDGWEGAPVLQRRRVESPAPPVESARAESAASFSPQPQAVGETLNVSDTRTVTTDAYRYVNVGVTATGTINQSSGTFSVGSTGSTGAGNLSLGDSANQTGNYNLSNSGVLNVAGDIFIGGGVDGNGGPGNLSQTGGSVSVLLNGITMGSTGGVVSTYTISAGTLTSPFILIGDSGPAVFTQSGGTVTGGVSSTAGGSNFYSDAFSFSNNTNATYQLNGGTLAVPYITTLYAGFGAFNFNGGVLQATAQPTARIFLGADPNNVSVQRAILTANIQANGAKIDTNGLSITIAQPLVHFSDLGATPDGGLTKQTGSGTLTLTAANTYTGPTVISAGTMKIDNNSAASPATAGQLTGTSAITINNGGTLLLSGAAAVTDRLNNAAAVNLNGGGTFATSGLKEGAVPTSAGGTGGAVGLGALTLGSTASSSRAIIDFASTGGSALVFSSLATSGKGAFVSVINFTGAQRIDSGASANDRLLFTSDPGFTVANLANWQFSNDAGTNYATGGLEIPYNGYFEIVPVPEPATWVGGAMLLGTVGTAIRRRRRTAAATSMMSGCLAPANVRVVPSESE